MDTQTVPMRTKLQVEVKSVYGNTLVYPVCDQAKLLAQLLQTKTFAKNKIDLLQQIGFEFEILSPQFEGVA